MHFSKKSGNNRRAFTIIEILVVVIIIGVLLSAAWNRFGGLPISAGYFGQVWTVVYHNFGFWLVVVASIVYGLYVRWKQPDEFLWWELCSHSLLAFTLSAVAFDLSFTTATDLNDKEIQNGFVRQAEYDERWVETVTTSRTVCDKTDKDGNCISSHTEYDTSYVEHPATYTIISTVGEITIDDSVFNRYCNLFGNVEKKWSHTGRDGLSYKWITRYDGSFEKLVPVAREHSCINYVRAAKPMRHRRLIEAPDKRLVRDYPIVTPSDFGPIYLDRIIEADLRVPGEWKQSVNSWLNRSLAKLGEAKQVNVIVYLANTADENFVATLDEDSRWVGGKKNDVVVVVGVTQFPNMEFVGILSWTRGETFRDALKKRILIGETLQDPVAFAEMIIDQIRMPSATGGYERVPMKEFEHLVRDIRLPWWCNLIIVIVIGSANWLMALLFTTNSYRRYRPWVPGRPYR